MKLSYRGVQYDYNPQPVELTEGEVSGQYRGSHFKFGYPRHIPVPQPILNLKYRGVAYRTTETGGTEAVRPAVRREEPVSVYARPVLTTKQALMSEVARIHRENIQRRLQHRIEVAREKGDQLLLNQLEQEMRHV
jgi:hypothetical protein